MSSPACHAARVPRPPENGFLGWCQGQSLRDCPWHRERQRRGGMTVSWRGVVRGHPHGPLPLPPGTATAGRDDGAVVRVGTGPSTTGVSQWWRIGTARTGVAPWWRIGTATTGWHRGGATERQRRGGTVVAHRRGGIHAARDLHPTRLSGPAFRAIPRPSHPVPMPAGVDGARVWPRSSEQQRRRWNRRPTSSWGAGQLAQLPQPNPRIVRDVLL